MQDSTARHKLLLLITNFGPGGAQRAFYDQSIYLKDRYDVSEAVFDKDELPLLYPTGNPLYSLDVKGGNSVREKLANFRQRARKLRDLIAQKNVELCISHMDGANWVNVLSGS